MGEAIDLAAALQRSIDNAKAARERRQPEPEHVCHETDSESVACIVDWTGKPNIYGPCSDDDCGGVCEHFWACECDCHPSIERNRP